MTKEKELEKKRKAAAEAAKKAKEAMELSEKLAAELLALEKEVSTVSVSSSEGAPPSVKKDVQAEDDSSSDSSDSDTDKSDDEDEPKKVVPKKEVEATGEKEMEDEDSSDGSSSDSDSSSGSSSDDDNDAVKVKEPVEVNVKKDGPKVDDESNDASSGSSSDSDSGSSESEDEDGENEEKKQTNGIEDKKKTKVADVKATPAKEANGNKRGASAFTPEDDKRQATTKIYVRGLAWRASEDEIHDYFTACGEIESLELPLQDDGRSSGTAIITFKESAGSSAAIELNGQEFQGRWLSIKYSTPKPILTPKSTSEKPPDCKTIFVGNLSFQIDEDSLRDAFKDCGEISMVRFATDRETGDFKGFGHIEFVDSEAVDRAMEMAGTDILGRAVRVDYAEDKRRGSFGGGGSFGDRGGGGGRGRFGGGGGGGGRAEYMGKGGSGGRRGGGRQGRGRGDNRSGGGMAKAKKTGAIAEFSGNKITF